MRQLTKVMRGQIAQILAYRGESLAITRRVGGGHGSTLNRGVTWSEFAELPPAFVKGLTGGVGSSDTREEEVEVTVVQATDDGGFQEREAQREVGRFEWGVRSRGDNTCSGRWV